MAVSVLGQHLRLHQCPAFAAASPACTHRAFASPRHASAAWQAGQQPLTGPVQALLDLARPTQVLWQSMPACPEVHGSSQLAALVRVPK